jgi:hypothetical protein
MQMRIRAGNNAMHKIHQTPYFCDIANKEVLYSDLLQLRGSAAVHGARCDISDPHRQQDCNDRYWRDFHRSGELPLSSAEDALKRFQQLTHALVDTVQNPLFSDDIHEKS